MWCRTILTAVAISYVICVLLLSGLQKEDLDANNLEKLRQHNVNFDDMNNEKLRQECLLNSYSDTGNVTQKNETTEDQNKALEMSTTISDNEGISLTNYPVLRIDAPDNILNKISRSGLENNKSQGQNSNLKTNYVKDDLANITKIEENDGLQVEYLHNQPSLQSVINFWTKLTHNSKKVVTKVAPTLAPSNTVEEKNILRAKADTPYNNGYVHSREMEYISRILAEYMASQTVPTTTQRITTKKVYIGMIAKRLEDYMKIYPKNEKTNPLREVIEQILNNKLKIDRNFTGSNEQLDLKKNIEQQLKDNLEKVNNFSQDDKRPRKPNEIYSMTDENMPFNAIYDDILRKPNIQDNVQQRQFDYSYVTAEIKTMRSDNKLQMKQDKSYNQQKLTEKNNPIRFLNYRLQNEKGFTIDDVPILNTDTTTESIKLAVNEDNEQKEKNELFNRYGFFQFKLPDFNNSEFKNPDRNTNVGIFNYQFKSEPTVIREWEPIRSYKILNKQFQFVPINNIETDQQSNANNDSIEVGTIMTNLELAENFGMNDQFQNLPSNINDSKRIKTFSLPTEIINSEQKQNLNTKVNPKDVRKWKHYKITEIESDQFKNMLPSIKKSNQNQNRLKLLRTELNNSEQLKKNMMYDDGLKDIMAAETNSNDGEQVSALNNDQLNVKPYVEKAEQNSNLSKYDNIVRTIANSLDEKVKIPFQYVPVNTDNFKRNQSNNQYQPQAIPTNVIDDIAEKVRQIVLKDIRKEVPTTTVKPSSSTTTTAVTTTSTTVPTTSTTAVPTTSTTSSTTVSTTASTSVSTTASTTVSTTVSTTASPLTESTFTTTEKPTTRHKEIKQANHVIQKLMEMFDELKAMKEAGSSTAEVPLEPTLKNETITRVPLLLPMQTLPPAFAAFNPYTMKTPSVNFVAKTSSVNFKPFDVSVYGPRMVPVPLNSGANPPKDSASQYVPHINFQQRNEYKTPAITIQTNADEIAPLAIQISKPLKLMNQHIIVTTKSPSELLKEEQERESKHRIEENFLGPTNVRNHKEKHHDPLDLEKKLRLTDSAKRHEYSDTHSHKSTLNKNKENSRYNRDYSANVPDITHAGSSRYPWSSTHAGSSSYPGSSNYPAISNYPVSSSQPGSSSYPGSSIYTGAQSFLGSSSQPENSRHPWTSTQIGSFSYPGSLSHQRGQSWDMSRLDSLNRPKTLSHSRGSFNYPVDRQDGLKYHAGSFRYDPERPRPRYGATKFHEQLERIENWPRDSWKGHRPLSKEKNCCEEIPARQQMPLTKVKQRTRFDDTHFTNFLKSQQKVTDMLERILANNIKSNGPRSVETP